MSWTSDLVNWTSVGATHNQFMQKCTHITSVNWQRALVTPLEKRVAQSDIAQQKLLHRPTELITYNVYIPIDKWCKTPSRNVET